MKTDRRHSPDRKLSTALLCENLEDESNRNHSHGDNAKAHKDTAVATAAEAVTDSSCDNTAVTASGQNGVVKPTKSSFKIIVLGDSGVGKTCLTFRFCAGRFPLFSEATIGLDFREKIIELDGQRLKLQLWDTAGQERFRKAITHHYYRNVDAVVFVYDVNYEPSFEGLDLWVEEVESHGVPPNVPRILVGNKCDTGEQRVDTTEAQRWADDRHMPLFETSAKDDSLADHVDGIFLTLAHKVKHRKHLIRPVADPSDPGTQPVRLLYQSSLTKNSDSGWTSCCV